MKHSITLIIPTQKDFFQEFPSKSRDATNVREILETSSAPIPIIFLKTTFLCLQLPYLLQNHSIPVCSSHLSISSCFMFSFGESPFVHPLHVPKLLYNT